MSSRAQITAQPSFARRLIAACHALSRDPTVVQMERRLPALALEVSGASGAALGVLDDPREDFARLLTAAGGEDDGANDGVEHEVELLRAVHEQQSRKPAGLREDVVSGRATTEDGEALTFHAEAVDVGGGLHGWLCVTTSADEGFTDDEREALGLLLRWAGMAMTNVSLLETAQAREVELLRAVQGLGASGRVAEAVSREPRLELVLERIVEEAVSLVDARFMLALLADEDGLTVVAQTGDISHDLRGLKLPRRGTLLGEVLDEGRSRRVENLVRRGLWNATDGLGDRDMSGLLAPMLFRGRPLGMLAAIERRGVDRRYDADDERLLQSFAASAAAAVASARSVEEQRLRRTLEAAEQERRRWARELHDETLQGLGLLRIGLTAAMAKPKADLRAAMSKASDGLADEIERLRALINELRPAMLDELGLEPALYALVERTRYLATFPIEVTIDLDDRPRLRRDLEVIAYRVAQEALSNIFKYAQPQHVTVSVMRRGERLEITVTDDGIGFDPDTDHTGVGFVGMRERVALASGTLTISSRPGYGTRIEAVVPIPPD